MKQICHWEVITLTVMRALLWQHTPFLSHQNTSFVSHRKVTSQAHLLLMCGYTVRPILSYVVTEEPLSIRTINLHYCWQLSQRLREQGHRKRLERWRNQYRVINHHKAPAHSYCSFFAAKNMTVFPHPHWLPEFVHCDLFFFLRAQ